MKKLEEQQNKDELPCFVVDSIGLSQLPKFGIEDINEIGLAERIRRVEIKLLRMDNTISNMMLTSLMSRRGQWFLNRLGLSHQ